MSRSDPIFYGAALLAAASTGAPALAQVQYAPPPAGLCLFNQSVALDSSQAGRGANQRLDQIVTGMRAELATQQQAIAQEGKALQEARTTIPAAQYQQRSQQLQQRIDALQQLIQLRNAQLGRTRARAEQQIVQAMNPILVATIISRKCGVVLNGTAALGANPAADLTPAVVQDLDRRLPAIQVQLATPESGPQPATRS